MCHCHSRNLVYKDWMLSALVCRECACGSADPPQVKNAFQRGVITGLAAGLCGALFLFLLYIKNYW